MVYTIEKLPKWNGHLYNWYNTNTLEPLMPRYISTVDNGNFIGYLYTLKQFLISVNNSTDRIDRIIESTDFSLLYDNKKDLFSIGFNVEEGKLTNSYYDLLASEARQASIIAIAKKDVPSKHWGNLSRTLTTLKRYKGLISWSGTSFEYLMPNINIPKYDGSILDESCRFLVMSQIEYSKELGIPWGISEAAFNLKDLNNNYQYKSFGIPWLGLKRGLADDMVISPYSTFLSLEYKPKETMENLKQIEKEKMVGKYGFYEALDYTRNRLNYNEKSKTVKTYMAHHQGLILLSINNYINNKILVERFKQNPEIASIEILLQERMQEKAIITKEKKEKVEKINEKNYENYIETSYSDVEKYLNNSNTISNGEYTICLKDTGEGFSKYKNIFITRYKETADVNQGILFYIKDIKNNSIWNNMPLNNKNKYNIKFAPNITKFSTKNENIETETKIIVTPDDAVEIRRLEIKNIGVSEKTLEISNYLEPILSRPEQDYAHMTFNNLFLTFECVNDDIVIKRKKRMSNENDIFLATTLYTEDNCIGNFEYEIDKEKILGKKISDIPEIIKESKPYSKNMGLVTDPALSMKRTIKVMPNETITLDFIMSVSHNKLEAIETLQKYKNTKVVSKIIELSRAKTEAETIYLGLSGKDIVKYQKMLSYIIFQNPIKKLQINNLSKKVYSQSKLWKYGISGDLPILLVKIKDINDIYIINDVLKAFEFFRSKNILIDLVILNEETNSYDQYTKYEIENTIQNKQLGFLKNISGGIFVIDSNKIPVEDLELLEFKSNLMLDAKKGNIDIEIKDMEDEYLKSVSNTMCNEISNLTNENNFSKENKKFENLEYYNEYGGFSENQKEYKIKIDKQNKLPTVWSMILANENFGTLITQNLGGFTWNRNSRLNRLSSWVNNPVQDIPSEIIYIKDEDKQAFWTLSDNLNEIENDVYLSYGFGYVKYTSTINNLEHELKIFVPQNDNVKINMLKFKNLEPNKRKLKLIYYIKTVNGEDEIKTNGNILVEKDANIVYIKNLYKDSFKNYTAFIGTSEKISSYTGSKKLFIGNESIKKPNGVKTVTLEKNNRFRRIFMRSYRNRN